MSEMTRRRLLWAMVLTTLLVAVAASWSCLSQDMKSRTIVETIKTEILEGTLTEARIEALFGKPGTRKKTKSGGDDLEVIGVYWMTNTWDRGFISVEIRLEANGRISGLAIGECRPFWQWMQNIRTRFGL